MSKQYIGKKKVREIKETTEKTPGGIDIKQVFFEDESVEYISSIMLDKIVTDQQVDDTKLRDLRVIPVVDMILSVMREWGIKTGELPYMSALLNQSMDFNSSQALISLLADYMPKPNSLDEVDLLTIDRILKVKSKPVDASQPTA